MVLNTFVLHNQKSQQKSLRLKRSLKRTPKLRTSLRKNPGNKTPKKRARSEPPFSGQNIRGYNLKFPRGTGWKPWTHREVLLSLRNSSHMASSASGEWPAPTGSEYQRGMKPPSGLPSVSAIFLQ